MAERPRHEVAEIFNRYLERDVLAVPYAHIVFTMPQTLAPLALQNKKVVYDLPCA